MGFTNYPHGVTSFGIPLFGGMPIRVPGNTYVVANSLSDTNFSYLKARFGNTAYEDGSQMFQVSLQDAINACVDWRGDLILVGPFTFVVTTPVLFNKKGITVASTFDISGEDNGERFTLDSQGTANIPCAIISEPATFINLGFSGTSVAAGAVQLGPGNGFDGGNYVEFLGCRFTNWGHAAWALDLNYNDYVKVIKCDFDGTINGLGGSANVFAYGVHLIQGHYCLVEECTFRGCTYAIGHGVPNPATAAHSNMNFIYKGNRVIVATGGEKFIDFNNLATYTEQYGLVADNWLPTATDAASYSDTVANIKAAHVAFSGNHYAE